MKVVVTESFFDSLKECFGIKGLINEIRSWLHYHFRKDFFKILKEVFKSYPYDSSYLLYLEQVKIREMANYIEKSARYEGYEKDVKWMRIADKLIDIITEKTSLFHYDGTIEFVKREDGNYEMVPSADHKYVCDVKVNIRNINRFIKPDDQKFFLPSPHEIYLRKARHLYHMIRLNYEEHWWD